MTVFRLAFYLLLLLCLFLLFPCLLFLLRTAIRSQHAAEYAHLQQVVGVLTESKARAESQIAALEGACAAYAEKAEATRAAHAADVEREALCVLPVSLDCVNFHSSEMRAQLASECSRLQQQLAELSEAKAAVDSQLTEVEASRVSSEEARRAELQGSVVLFERIPL